MTKFVRSFMFVLVLTSFVLTACGAATKTAQVQPTTASMEQTATTVAPEANEAPTEDATAMYAPDAATGDFVAAGSSTVFPLYERMKQRFEEEGYTGNNTYDSIGTGGGFERFCKTGETDVAGASRKIKDTELNPARPLAAIRWPSVLVRMPSPLS